MKYELLVTSCDRPDLLKRTLDSFAACADITPFRTVILEDGPNDAPDWFHGLRDLGQKVWLKNGERMGQAYSLCRLYEEATTEYAFHYEEDWEGLEGNYVRKSFDILKQHPQIACVSLRGTECNGHPLVADPRYPFRVQEPYWNGVWGGWSFNPTAVRVKDVRELILPHARRYIGQHGLGCEAEVSKLMLDAGYRIASLSDAPHIRHIGNNRSRAVEKLEIRVPKILIAVPACWKLSYGTRESEKSPHYDPKNEAYGVDIHISGENDRIAAVRDTWWKDIEKFENIDGRFFYGSAGNEIRYPEPDEVVLDTPDDYQSLPTKVREICRWALDHGYDYVLKCDDDTAIYVDRLFAEIVRNRPDYGGYVGGSNYCSGGPGYILSRRAMRAVVEHGEPTSWAEDVNTSHALNNANIKPTMLEGHVPGFSAHWYFCDGFDPRKLHDKLVAFHAVQPEMMREWYSRK